MNARHKFLIGSGIISATLLALAYVGFTQSKTYYHTITELSTLQGPSLHQRMRVSGNVRAGSIAHTAGRVDFVLTEQGRDLPVSYVGRDPLPDTFKDGAQALVEGKMKPDNHFGPTSPSQVRLQIRSSAGRHPSLAAARANFDGRRRATFRKLSLLGTKKLSPENPWIF